MNKNIKDLAGISLMLAMVVVLQLIGSVIKFGPFSISLVLVPIVLTAGLYGPWAGGLAGLVFGIVVIASGDAASFMAVTVIGTVIVCLTKGALAGIVSGLIFKAGKVDSKLTTLLASISCPIVNTFTFLVGCRIFFFDTVASWASALGYGENVFQYMIFGLVGLNFVVELIINSALAFVIYRLIKIRTN